MNVEKINPHNIFSLPTMRNNSVSRRTDAM